jgi:hypothetical protein
MSLTIEALLRDCRMTYGHIQLFRDAAGWQASVYHYEPKRLTHDGVACADPVDALRLALIEDERRSRDLERRYAAAEKAGAVDQATDADGACLICEGGGCDLCNPISDESFEELFG